MVLSTREDQYDPEPEPLAAFQDIVSEWLRRWTRNPLGSARAGSNPADVVYGLKIWSKFF